MAQPEAAIGRLWKKQLELVGWFESEQEEKKTCIAKKENIAKLLESQEQDLVGQGHKVKHLIVDCSYSLPPPPAKKSLNARKRKG